MNEITLELNARRDAYRRHGEPSDFICSSFVSAELGYLPRQIRVLATSHKKQGYHRIWKSKRWYLSSLVDGRQRGLFLDCYDALPDDRTVYFAIQSV